MDGIKWAKTWDTICKELSLFQFKKNHIFFNLRLLCLKEHNHDTTFRKVQLWFRSM